MCVFDVKFWTMSKFHVMVRRQISRARKFRPSQILNQLQQLQTSCQILKELQISCKSSFHIAAANLKKLQNYAIIFIQRMREEKAVKLQNLSEILGVENLKNLQISAIIYIQGERKVTHRKIKKLIGS